MTIQQSEALNAVGFLAHHLESDVTVHGEATQCKSVGRRREDRSGNPTYRVMSRVVCDTYRDLSSKVAICSAKRSSVQPSPGTRTRCVECAVMTHRLLRNALDHAEVPTRSRGS